MRSGREQRKRSWRERRPFLETLESRLLLTVYAVHDSGSPTTNGTNLQTTINGATSGDIIILDAGVKYAANISLPNQAFPVGSAPITIESSALASLPVGVRVSPAQANLMPKILCTGGPNSGGPSAITASAYSHDYQFLGIEFSSYIASYDVFNSIIAIGVNGPTQTSTSQVPQNFLIDRCYVHGTPGYDSKCGISLNGLNVTVSNCYVSDIHSTHQDCQAISGSNGLGHYTITNNYLEASCENILFGGADPSITTPGFLPNDTMLIQGNYFSKPMSWDPYSPSYIAPIPNPNYPGASIQYWCKNIFELKNASNLTINDNIFENCWAGADQWGFAIVFTPRNQQGGDPTARINNI